MEKLVIKDLKKTYGKKVVLNGVNIEFNKGKIYSIIGKNGAGKTTFFNCINNNIRYEEGDVSLVKGGVLSSVEFEDIGLVADTPVLPDFLTGYEFVYFFSGLHKKNNEKEIDDYFNLVKINYEDRHKLLKDYSFGMKNKIQLLCCLIRKPEVILLDEPLSSFDILVSHDIKELLMQIKKDHIIVMSTHIMQLAQDISDEVVILKDGKMNQIDATNIHDSKFEKFIIEELDERKIV